MIEPGGGSEGEDREGKGEQMKRRGGVCGRMGAKIDGRKMGVAKGIGMRRSE